MTISKKIIVLCVALLLAGLGLGLVVAGAKTDSQAEIGCGIVLGFSSAVLFGWLAYQGAKREMDVLEAVVLREVAVGR